MLHPQNGQKPHARSPPVPSTADVADDSDGQSADDQDHDLDDYDATRTENGKRKRPISVSCELCKQRKVKCDRGQPSCGWCSRNGALCEYKERKKPGLRAGYGRELEQRLDKLEEIIRQHSEILENSIVTQRGNMAPSVRHSNPSNPSDQGTPRDVTVFRASEPIRTPQTDAALFLQKPSTFSHHMTQSVDFGLTAPQASLQDSMQTQMHVPGRSLSTPSHVAGTAGPSGAQDLYGSQNLHSPTLSMTHAQSSSAPSEPDLPPYDLLYSLADLYFKHINTWCPILNRKSTLDSLFGPTKLDETDKILLHAMVATTLRFSNDQRLTEERRQHYHDTSKQKVLLYGMENSSVKCLQALVILALDLCGSGNGPPGWNIMALITRSVVQLGLAVESTSFSVSPNYPSIYTLRAMVLPEPKDFLEEESRRRLFWMVYLLDRYATLATAFEFALDEKEIDRTLPCRDDLWIKNQKVETRWFKTGEQTAESPGYDVNKPENLGAFAYYIEILGILSKIHQFLKQPVDIGAVGDVERWQAQYKDLDSMLTNWKFGLPGDYGNMAKLFHPAGNKALNCGWVMLHATYHTAVIRLHSSAAYPTTRSPIFTPSYSASQRCHGAVENVAALGEFVVNSGLLSKLGPPFAFTLWVAARLLLVHGSTVERKLSPQIAFFVDALREMGRLWPVAARYCQLLQRVLDEHRDSERQGDGVTPSSVRILADMRRTAFDLDFLISHQPRHGNGHGHGHGNGLAQAFAGMPSVPPVRTPAPNELEYLDVFDFFNVPRLPVGGDHYLNGMQHLGAPGGNGGNGGNAGGEAPSAEEASAAFGEGMLPHGEFSNITNFMVDANSDWLFKQEGSSGPGKYLSR